MPPDRESGKNPGVAGPLWVAYPNPAHGGQPVDIEVLVSQGGARVSASVYSVTGRLLAQLIDSRLASGRAAIRWNGRRATGQPVEPRVYFLRVRIGTTLRVAKVLLTD